MAGGAKDVEIVREERKSLDNALLLVKEDEMWTMSSIAGTALRRVRSTDSGSGEAFVLLDTLQELVNYLTCPTKEEPMVRLVCELALDFIEWALLKYLTRHRKLSNDLRKNFPVECTEIDTILTFVKTKMEVIDEKIKEAMEKVERAMNTRNTEERTVYLQMFETNKSYIQSVFGECRRNVDRATGVLEKLKPDVERSMQQSKVKTVKVATVVSLVVGFAVYYWHEASPTQAVTCALLTGGVSYGFTALERSVLRDALADYSVEVSIIIKIERMKSKLKSGEDFLFVLSK